MLEVQLSVGDGTEPWCCDRWLQVCLLNTMIALVSSASRVILQEVGLVQVKRTEKPTLLQNPLVLGLKVTNRYVIPSVWNDVRLKRLPVQSQGRKASRLKILMHYKEEEKQLLLKKKVKMNLSELSLKVDDLSLKQKHSLIKERKKESLVPQRRKKVSLLK